MYYMNICFKAFIPRDKSVILYQVWAMYTNHKN